MHRIRFNYSLKNIGLPSQHQYKKQLIEKAESVVQRMRWKAHFFLNGECSNENNKFGLPSRKWAPPISEMKAFEEDVIKMVSNVKFRDVQDPFLQKLSEDMKAVNTSENILVFADKTRNIYAVSPDTYDKLMTKNITKAYSSYSIISTMPLKRPSK